MRAEIYVGTYAGDSQVWDIDDVEIPDDTLPENYEEAAKAAWRNQDSDRIVAFYGLLYVSPNDEEPT